MRWVWGLGEAKRVLGSSSLSSFCARRRVSGLIVRLAGEGQREVLRGGRTAARSAFEGYVTDMERTFQPFGSFEQTVDGEELDSGIAGAVGGGIEARFGSLLAHGFGRFGEADVDADFGLHSIEKQARVLTIVYSNEVALLQMTYQLAHAAGMDAGNRAMREGGRIVWTEEDYGAAAAEFARLWPICEHRSARAECVVGAASVVLKGNP